MFIGSIEDMARERVADYERRVSRMVREREAHAAAEADSATRAHPCRQPWYRRRAIPTWATSQQK